MRAPPGRPYLAPTIEADHVTNCWRLLCPLAGVLLAAVCLGCTEAPTKSATANHEAAVSSHDGGSAACMVATVNPYATRAGVAAFERGGNALDAAIAAALTLGVVDSSNSGIGGGCFILIRTPGGEVAAIDGREIAPAAATRDMYLRDGEADPALSQTGALAVAVPGALAAYELAIQRHGQLTLADLLRPAADLAAAGFPIDRVLAARIEANQDDLARFAGARSVFLKRDRTPWPRKHLLKQPDLAKTYRAIADEGVDWFYRGPFADKVGEWMRGNGGILTAEDFAAYRAVEREPLRTSYRQWTIVGFPPPSSGGVHVGQILNMLERFDMAEEYRRDPAQALHLVAEAMKRAFADRAHWLGDPDFVDVPRGLLDQAYADELARRIDPRRAVAVAGHGDPPGAAEDVFGKKHTTHIAAVDSDGTWVAITATINTHFGSKVIVPGTGVLLNNEMDDFSAQPGKPNAFGLVGAESNAIAPHKRPLSSMSPTIVLRDGVPVMTVGAAGGPKIITQAVLAIVRRLDFEESLAAAVAAPRIHHQWRPDVLMIERTMPAEIVEGLARRGHLVELSTSSAAGATQAIEQNAKGALMGVFEPRTPGEAASGRRPREAAASR